MVSELTTRHVSTGTRAAAQKAPLQQRLAGPRRVAGKTTGTTGLAITAGIDQTPVGAIRGKHLDKIVFSTYKSNHHKGLKTTKQLIAYVRDMHGRVGGLAEDPRHLGDTKEAYEFIDSIPTAMRGFWPSGGRRALTRVWTRGRRRSATSRRPSPRPPTASSKILPIQIKIKILLSVSLVQSSLPYSS